MHAADGKPVAALLSGVLALVFLTSAAAAQPARDVVTVLTGPRTLVGLQDASDAASAANPTTRFVRDLLDAAAVDMEFSVLPWSRVLQRLGNEANVLAFYVIRTPVREDLYEWIGMIQPIETYLYTLRGRLSNPPATLEQARSFRIGVARRSATADFLEARGFENLYYLPDVNRAPFLISRNRIDLSIFTASEVGSLLASGAELGAELEPLIYIPEMSGGTYLAMSRATTPELVARIRLAYEQLVENGRYDQFRSEILATDSNPLQ